jgi:hypothetical protein
LQWSTLFQHCRKGDGGDEWHDQTQLAVLLNRIEYRYCVRVLESCGDPSLTHRPLVGQLCFLC